MRGINSYLARADFPTTTELGEAVDRQRLRIFAIKNALQASRQELVGLDEVHAPDDAIARQVVEMLRRKVRQRRLVTLRILPSKYLRRLFVPRHHGADPPFDRFARMPVELQAWSHWYGVILGRRSTLESFRKDLGQFSS
jgi:hypothetical protein